MDHWAETLARVGRDRGSAQQCVHVAIAYCTFASVHDREHAVGPNHGICTTSLLRCRPRTCQNVRSDRRWTYMYIAYIVCNIETMLPGDVLQASYMLHVCAAHVSLCSPSSECCHDPSTRVRS